MAGQDVSKRALERVRWAQEVGWRVEQVNDGAYRIWPDGQAVPIEVHRTSSDVNAIRQIDRLMRAAGYPAARVKADARAELARLAAIEADREANDRRTKAVLAKASGPYQPLGWTAEQLLEPHPAPLTTTVDIGPVLAAKMLDHNGANRPVSGWHVDYLARMMAAGQWLLTHQGIAFDTEGRLLDGQHRLSAVVASGATVTMRVSVGMDPSMFAVMDTGRVRTAGDAVAMAGHEHHTALAAAARLLAVYDLAALGSNRIRVSNQQVLAVIDGNPGLVEAMPLGMRVARGCKMPGRVAVMSAYLILGRGGRRDLGEPFLEQLVTGADQPPGSPVLAVRKYFLVTVQGLRHTPAEDLGAVLKGWRAYCQHRKVQTVALRANEGFPGLYLPPPRIEAAA